MMSSVRPVWRVPRVSGDKLIVTGILAISLASAASQASLSWDMQAPSAIMTACMVDDIAEYWRQRKRKTEASPGSESL